MYMELHLQSTARSREDETEKRTEKGAQGKRGRTEGSRSGSGSGSGSGRRRSSPITRAKTTVKLICLINEFSLNGLVLQTWRMGQRSIGVRRAVLKQWFRLPNRQQQILDAVGLKSMYNVRTVNSESREQTTRVDTRT